MQRSSGSCITLTDRGDRATEQTQCSRRPVPNHLLKEGSTMTNEQAQAIAAATIRESNARQALADTERKANGISAARQARAELSQASAALQALIDQERAGQ